jgi:hypothetical protein
MVNISYMENEWSGSSPLVHHAFVRAFEAIVQASSIWTINIRSEKLPANVRR